MRKPRDYDAELKALEQKAKSLKIRKQSQLGELVMATGADTLAIEELAGALLAAAGAGADAATREGWRKNGAAFFLRGSDSAPSDGVRAKRSVASPNTGGAASFAAALGAS